MQGFTYICNIYYNFNIIVLSVEAALKKLCIINAAIDGLRLLAALIWENRTRRKAGRIGRHCGYSQNLFKFNKDF